MAITIQETSRFSLQYRIFTVNLHGSEITVTVTAEASVVRQWLSTSHYVYRHFLHRLVVGLGVQWTPGPGGRDAPADTLQICIGHRCLIYQLAQTHYVPRRLRRFLLNPSYTFVGFWNHSDRNKLKNSKHELLMYRDPLDLRNHVVGSDDDESLTGASMEEIVWEYLEISGVSLKREISMSYWGDELLSEDQVLQACLDAHCAFLIGRNIRAWEIAG